MPKMHQIALLTRMTLSIFLSDFWDKCNVFHLMSCLRVVVCKGAEKNLQMKVKRRSKSIGSNFLQDVNTCFAFPRFVLKKASPWSTQKWSLNNSSHYPKQTPDLDKNDGFSALNNYWFFSSIFGANQIRGSWLFQIHFRVILQKFCSIFGQFWEP